MECLISAAESDMVGKPWVGVHLDLLAREALQRPFIHRQHLLHRQERSAVSELQVRPDGPAMRPFYHNIAL